MFQQRIQNPLFYAIFFPALEHIWSCQKDTQHCEVINCMAFKCSISPCSAIRKATQE